MHEQHPTLDAPSTNSQKLAVLLESILGKIEKGTAIDLEALRAEHPEMAPQLEQCIQNLKFFEGAAGWMDSSANSSGTGAESHDLPFGQIGDFRIIRQLGRGGMGVVYEAEQISLRRNVALKILPFAALIDSRALQRFKNEVAAVASLEHPHIVDVYAVACDKGVHHFAMRLIRGGTIAQILQQMREQDNDVRWTTGLSKLSRTPSSSGKMDSTEKTKGINTKVSKPAGYYDAVACFGISIAEALDYAHEHGVIHRDIKPSNLMIDEDGKAWITDFGLAQVEAGSQLTLTGDLLGTAQYMSPEQLMAKRIILDHRTDIYSLGITLYEMLALNPPFQSDNRQELFRQIMLEEPRALRKLNPAIPEDLETIVLKTIEKNPADRYQSARALTEDLSRFVKRETIRAKRPGVFDHVRKFTMRNSAAVTTTALASMFAVILLTIGMISVWNSERKAIAYLGIANAETAKTIEVNAALKDTMTNLAIEKEAAVTQRNEAQRLQTEAERLQSEAQRSHSAADASRIEANRSAEDAKLAKQQESAQRERAEKALYVSDTRLAASQLETRSNADAYESLMRQYPTESKGDLRSWEWYYLVDQTQRSDLSWPAHLGSIPSVDWSPDGTRIATVSFDGRARVWDAVTGQKLQEWPEGRTLKHGVKWHPKNNQLAWGSVETESLVRIWDGATNEITKLTANTGSVHSVQWNHDGSKLAVGAITENRRDERNLVVWENTGVDWRIQSRTSVPIIISFAGWNSDESLIAVVAGEGLIRIFDSADLALRHEIADRQISTGDWHPTKNLLAFGTAGGEYVIFDANSFEEVTRIRSHFGGLNGLAWSKDGNWLATCGADAAVKIWDTRDWSLFKTFHGHQGMVYGVSWHPNSDRLVSVGTDGTANVWSLMDGPAFVELKSDKGLFVWTDDNLIRSISRPSTVVDRDPHAGEIKRTIQLPDSGNWSLMSHDLALQRIEHEGNQSTRVISLQQPKQSSTGISNELNGAFFAHPLGAAIVVSPGGLSRPILFEIDNSRRTVLGTNKFVHVHQIAWSPDLHTIAIVGAGREGDGGTPRSAGWLDFVDASNGKDIGRVRVGHNRLHANAVAWSPDSQRVVAATIDGLCEVFDASNYRVLASKRIHRASVNSVKWHPVENRVASSGDDRNVNIWDSETGDTLLRLPVNDTVLHIEWSKDGKLLAAKDVSGTIRIWDASRGYENVDHSLLLGVSHKRLLDEAERLAGSRQFDAAVLLLDELLTAEPEMIDALMHRAQIHRSQNQFELQIADYKRVVELDPSNQTAWNMRGVAEARLGRYSDAIASFTSAIEINADSEDSRISKSNRAKMYVELQQFPNALEEFRIVFESDNSIEDGRRVADLHRMLGDIETFNAVVKQLLDRVNDSSSNSEMQFVLWTCHAPLVSPEHLERALKIAEALHKNHTENPESGRWMAYSYYRMGRYEEAFNYLSRSSDPIPYRTTAYCWYYMAMVQEKLGNHESAVEWHAKANAETDHVLEPANSPNFEVRTSLPGLRDEATRVVMGEK